jgi:arginine decarboxylase
VALRQGRITLDESRSLLRMYEEGLSGYTYLERDVDAKFAASSHGQLRLVAPHEAGTPPRLNPPPTGT